MEAECGPGVDGQAGGNFSLVVCEAGAEQANRTPHRSSLTGPGCSTSMGRRGASGWLNLEWSSAYPHYALPCVGLDETNCPVLRVGVLCNDASQQLGSSEHNITGRIEHVFGCELKDKEIAGGGAMVTNGSSNCSR